MVFTNLLAHADSTGLVDKHWRAISEETGISEERVKQAIAHLEAPDLESRSPEEGGRRIIPVDEHRAWGWQIVNHGKYRAIRSEEDRREQNRLAQQKWREKKKAEAEERNNFVSKISRVSQDKPKQKQEAYTEAKKEKKAAATKNSDEEWIESLQTNPAYKLLDVRNEYARAQVWAETNHRQCTRRFFVNWLNRAKPMEINGNGTPRPTSEREKSAERSRNTRQFIAELRRQDAEEELLRNGGGDNREIDLIS